MCHETMFHLCLPATEKIVRTVVVYAFLVIGFRLAGKRELAQLKSFDLIVLIVIANAVQNAIIGPEDSITGGLIGGATLLIVNYLLVRITYQFPMLNKLLVGRETVLFEHGAIKEAVCKRELITVGDLTAIAARQNARSLDDVERIALEPNGNVVVQLKEGMTLTHLTQDVEEIKQLLRART